MERGGLPDCKGIRMLVTVITCIWSLSLSENKCYLRTFFSSFFYDRGEQGWGRGREEDLRGFREKGPVRLGWDEKAGNCHTLINLVLESIREQMLSEHSLSSFIQMALCIATFGCC